MQGQHAFYRGIFSYNVTAYLYMEVTNGEWPGIDSCQSSISKISLHVSIQQERINTNRQLWYI